MKPLTGSIALALALFAGTAHGGTLIADPPRPVIPKAVVVIRGTPSVGARILGLDDKVGTIAPDHLADILVVDGNPLEDLHHLRRIKYVMADGQILAKP